MATAEPPRQHPELDDLALLALDPDDAALTGVSAHTAACAACAGEVASLAAAAATARDAVSGVDRALPGPGVWEGIAAATGVRTSPDPQVLRSSLAEDGLPGVAAGPARAAPDAVVPPGRTAPAAGGPRRRRWSTGALVAAAAAALFVGAVAGTAVGVAAGGGDGDGDGDGDGQQVAPATAVLAAAQLVPALPGQAAGDGTGTAEVVTEDAPAAGVRRLVVDTTGLPSVPGAVHEVWLLDPTTGGLLSVGFLVDGTGPTGGYPLPEGVDLDRFSAVDISAEPLDGDAQHSGTSELRGTLTASTV